MYNRLIMSTFPSIDYGFFSSLSVLLMESERTGKTITRFDEFLMAIGQLAGFKQLELIPSSLPKSYFRERGHY